MAAWLLFHFLYLKGVARIQLNCFELFWLSRHKDVRREEWSKGGRDGLGYAKLPRGDREGERERVRERESKSRAGEGKIESDIQYSIAA